MSKQKTSTYTNANTTYKYDSNGRLRTETQNGVTRRYLYSSDGIVGYEQDGERFLYRKNLFGDIIAIYKGTTKVAEYVYDAWGNCTIVYNMSGYATLNPFRYRGYYWDDDLKMYYLMTRYYDPKTGRFINADTPDYLDPETLGGLNLYAYCGNNPVMFVDPSGHFIMAALTWIWNQVVGVVNNVAEDISNFDKNNTDENVVQNSNYFSYYKGTFVLKTPFKGSFSLGIIFFASADNSADTLKHEYGHILQLKSMGLGKYITNVAAPSVIAYWLDELGKLPYDYRSSPWEAEADFLGEASPDPFTDPWTPNDGYFWDLFVLFFK